MSLLKSDDYKRENLKNNKTHSHTRSKYHKGIAINPKTKYPSQHKSLNHKCSQCPRTDAKKYSISSREIRWLCTICSNKNKNKDVKEKPNFIKSSKLRIK